MAPRVAIVYDNDAHPERTSAPAPRAGIFGRDTANTGFVDAFLSFGHFRELVALVRDAPSAAAIEARFSGVARAPGRRLDVVKLGDFHARFFPNAPADVLHLPQPIDAQLAWARHHAGPHAFALSGVTHTLSLLGVMEQIRALVTAPLERYDTLFCISRAAAATVRAVADNYATYLRERHGGEPSVRARIAHVPFGVDAERNRPATAHEREAARRALGIAPDEICVLFFGRLSHHSKAHPFPMFRATSEAARRIGCKVHLLFAGWFESPAVQQRFQEGAEVLAPGVKTTIMDAREPAHSEAAWRAADVFNSLSDNIQESLGLTLLEAQARGLPVVTTDWDGCRETIEDGESGILVATHGVKGANTDDTSRHAIGEIGYGELLGRASQTIAVDTRQAASAFERLFAEPALRHRMGANGRARVTRDFMWQAVIERYERVWSEQELVRYEHLELSERGSARTPVSFPGIEHSFAEYPSSWVDDDTQLVVTAGAQQRLSDLVRLPLTSYLPRARLADEAALARVLTGCEQPRSAGELALLPELSALPRQACRATIAWLLKYDLLQLVDE